MIKKFILILLLPLLTFAGNEKIFDIKDLKDSFRYFYQGSYLQFTEKNNLYYAVPAFGSTYYAFEEDQRLSDHQRKKELRKLYDAVGDMGVFFSFPVSHISMYYIGKKRKDSKLVQFSKEYISTMYLTLLETGIISYIPGHERPNTEGQSKWETAFRGDNSFPSGHVVPYTTLFFKTLQFYGPYWAIIPGVVSYWSALQRVREGRHYISDVVGAFWLSAFASEGVRKAAGYKGNSEFYNKYFLNKVDLSFITYKGVIGPGIVYKF